LITKDLVAFWADREDQKGAKTKVKHIISMPEKVFCMEMRNYFQNLPEKIQETMI